MAHKIGTLLVELASANARADEAEALLNRGLNQELGRKAVEWQARAEAAEKRAEGATAEAAALRVACEDMVAWAAAPEGGGEAVLEAVRQALAIPGPGAAPTRLDQISAEARACIERDRTLLADAERLFGRCDAGK